MRTIAGTMNSMLAAPAPTGYHVDLSDPQTKGLELGLWIAVVGIVVSTTFFILRMNTKAALVRAFGIEDTYVVLSWAMAMSVQAMIMCKYGD